MTWSQEELDEMGFRLLEAAEGADWEILVFPPTLSHRKRIQIDGKRPMTFTTPAELALASAAFDGVLAKHLYVRWRSGIIHVVTLDGRMALQKYRERMQSAVKQPGVLPKGYQNTLRDLKAKIQAAQGRAGLAVNRELVLLYWQIGNDILEIQDRNGWGTKVIQQLSIDLQKEFPGVQGFSLRNMQYMRKFAEQYTDKAIVQQVVAQLPWSHNITLLDKFDETETRLWYAQKAIENGWSRNILTLQIESNLHARAANAQTNFAKALPEPQSELAQKVLKDPYIFDFLSLGPEAREADVERGLIEHMKQFLLEMGSGFSFVGSQYHLEIGGQDYYLDLLFYHLRLRCFVVLELKIGEFMPEHAGKMNFYLAAVDDHLKHIDDQPSIGIIMCKTANAVVTRYALRNSEKPIGVAEYRVTDALPENYKEKLPSPDEIKTEFEVGALSLKEEVARQNLILIQENGLGLETSLLLLACLKDRNNLIHFNEPQRMTLHFNTKTRQVFLHDLLEDKYILSDAGDIRYAKQNEIDLLLLQAKTSAQEDDSPSGHSQADNSVGVVDVEQKLLQSEQLKTWVEEYDSMHTVYRDDDIQKPEFLTAVAEASELWKKECESYLLSHGDGGSSVRGEGIKIRYLAPRKRKWKEKALIVPVEILGRTVGNIVWEQSAHKIVEFLQSKNIDAFFDCGSLD
ncbi:MAG: PDDEXK nuclease domain-containing protein [Candidatus Obscuribacterales bacterium]|jgi:predicted nuclease of restriction endonuclease-like (RecB) superfamily